MTINALLKVLPPPADPFEAFDREWGPVEAQFGHGLPQDYKDFARLYGSGTLLELIRLYVPISDNPNLRLYYNAILAEWTYREVKDLAGRLWPNPGGFLCFGSTFDGDELFWVTEGPPDEWRVAVMEVRSDCIERFDCDMTGFLAGLVSGELLPTAIAWDLSAVERPFVPEKPLPPEA